MNNIDILPILVPVIGTIACFTMSGCCCIRRYVAARYDALEARIQTLEHRPQPSAVMGQQPRVVIPIAPTNGGVTAYPVAYPPVYPSAPPAYPMYNSGGPARV
jgi:hypothetical protein